MLIIPIARNPSIQADYWITREVEEELQALLAEKRAYVVPIVDIGTYTNRRTVFLRLSNCSGE